MGLEKGLVVVADCVEWSRAEIDQFDRAIDRAEREVVDDIVQGLSTLVETIIVYDNLRDFTRKIHAHQTHLVFPLWAGYGSRNRHALVSALCEANGIRYIGGDAFTRALCNDKSLTKILLRSLGFRTPRGVLIRHSSQKRLVRVLRCPVIVKPNWEGGSIGISKDSIARDHDRAAERACELLLQLRQPIVVEEFASGKEVNVCLLGHGIAVTHFEAGERYVVGDDRFLETNVYGYELKKRKDRETAIRLVTDEIPVETRKRCCELFARLEKVELLRIDGRLRDGEFYVFELSPNPHLGRSAEFARTFSEAGVPYGELLRIIVENAKAGYRRLDASM